MNVRHCSFTAGDNVEAFADRVADMLRQTDNGDGVLVLTEVQPAGKARMSGAAFANGYQPVGQRLGA